MLELSPTRSKVVDVSFNLVQFSKTKVYARLLYRSVSIKGLNLTTACYKSIEFQEEFTFKFSSLDIGSTEPPPITSTGTPSVVLPSSLNV